MWGRKLNRIALICGSAILPGLVSGCISPTAPPLGQLETADVMNRGTSPIAVVFDNSNEVRCASATVQPAQVVRLALCGEGTKLGMNDGHGNDRYYLIKAAGYYEIYWDGNNWALKDTTADHQ